MSTLFPLLRLLPRNLISRIAGWLAHSHLIPASFHHAFSRYFARVYGINLSEMAAPSVDSFRTFGEFFIRKLKPGIRPLGRGIVSPCDGVLSTGGEISANMIVQVKEIRCGVGALVGDAQAAARLSNGSWSTIYLSPRHYHRVHSPIDGTVRRAFHIPGTLWPVNETSVQRVPGLFAVNERIVVLMESPDRELFAVVFVGATIVGKVSLSFDSQLTTNIPGVTGMRVKDYYSPAVTLSRGQEMGYFTLGSTIVLLREKKGRLGAALGTDMKMGQTLFSD